MNAPSFPMPAEIPWPVARTRAGNSSPGRTKVVTFGPNMTTFVMPSEVFPVTMRATGHGISAGIGKLGAFIGVFLFPLLQSSFGLRGTLLLTAGISVLGLALTLVLPEPAGRSLDEVSGGEPLIGSLAGGYPSAAESPSEGGLLVDVPSELRPGAPPDRVA